MPVAANHFPRRTTRRLQRTLCHRGLSFWLLPALVAAAILLATPASARADEDQDLQRVITLYNKGAKLYEAGQYRQALTSFESAYSIQATPGLLYNIGQCHRKLGDLEQAIAKMSAFLDLATDANPKQRSAARELIEEMTQTLADRAEAEKRARLLAADNANEDQPETKPLYKKWWFWATVGVVATAGAATTVFLLTRDGGVPGSELGNISLGVVRF